MGGFTVNQGAQVLAGAPGTVFLGPNTRVKGQLGFVTVQVDAVNFANGAIGFWVAPNVRTRVLGSFMVSQSGQGIAQPPPPAPPVPITVVTGDPRIRSL
jgi:hypothetical protein